MGCGASRSIQSSGDDPVTYGSKKPDTVSLFLTPPESPAALLDPDVGTSPWGDGAPPAKVLLLGPASGKSDKSSISSGPASRYQCITLSDEDSDNADEPKFNMQQWKRFFYWNKKKPGDLVKYLWKKFDAKIFSMYCISYRDQSKIVAAYQGENILSGLSCRLIETEIQAFSLGHTLFDPATSSYKVIGICIFEGQVPPKVWQAMPDFNDFAFVKVNSLEPVERDFVAALISSQSPVPDLCIVSTKEVLV